MLSPDGSECVPVITGCSVAVDNQPFGLAEVEKYGKKQWVCPDCSDTHYWDEKYNRCMECSDAIEHCTACSSEERCVRCEGDWFPSYLQNSC